MKGTHLAPSNEGERVRKTRADHPASPCLTLLAKVGVLKRHSVGEFDLPRCGVCFLHSATASDLGTKTKAQPLTRLTWMPLRSNLDTLQIELFPQGW